MKKLIYWLSIPLLDLLSSCGDTTNTQNELMKESGMFDKMTLEAPVAKKVPKELTTHGDTRIDNYYWMNQREDPEVISHLNAENAYKDSLLEHTNDFQKNLFEEIKGRIKQTDMSVPYLENGYRMGKKRSCWMSTNWLKGMIITELPVDL